MNTNLCAAAEADILLLLLHMLQNDVLSGRGGAVNKNPGNQRYRALVNALKAEYLSPQTRKLEKTHIAAKIVWDVRKSDPPGHFLKLDPSTGYWLEIGDKAAFRKTGQALRENAPELRSCYKTLPPERRTSDTDDGSAPEDKPCQNEDEQLEVSVVKQLHWYSSEEMLCLQQSCIHNLY